MSNTAVDTRAPLMKTVLTSPPTRRFLAVFVAFLFWECASLLAMSRLLPGPVEVMGELVEGVVAGTIWFHGQLTFQRGLAGLAIAVVVGVLLGVALARVRWVEAALEPLIGATYPVPKLAMFPLLILILGFGGASKIAMVAVECAYPVALTMYAAVQNIDKHYFWLASNVGAGYLARLGLVLRATTPAFLASLRMAFPIMLVIIVITEMIGESRGLGFLIRQSSTEFEPAEGLSIVLLLAIVGFVADRAIAFASRRWVFWAGSVSL